MGRSSWPRRTEQHPGLEPETDEPSHDGGEQGATAAVSGATRSQVRSRSVRASPSPLAARL
jgi:hypothetical protein